MVPADIYEQLQYQMQNAHATFKTGYDSILNHLESPPIGDLQNFAGYCLAWAFSIDLHHDSEEAVVFPFLNEKMDFSEEEEAHKIIHAELGKLTAAINEFKADISKFDAAKLRQMMIELKGPLFEHLDNEVEHIAPSKIKEAAFTEKELGDMLDRLVAYARGHGDPFLVLPFMRSHITPELKDSWPQMPWVLRKIIIPYVLGWKYSGYWKYSPYSLY